MTDKVTIEIDGKACEATPGEMIIAVADREGIDIPRFCYHKKLSIAATTRSMSRLSPLLSWIHRLVER